DAVRLEAAFERPDGFDVLDFIARSFASIPRAHTVEVLLRTDFATAQAQWPARWGYLEPSGDGVIQRTRVDDIEWYAGLLAGLPFDFDVRSPPELLEAMGALAARVARAARPAAR